MDMGPPFFPLVNVGSVHAVFGTPPARVRIFPFGDAPKDTSKPYAVWQTINGDPEQYLNQVPDSDDWLVQVDVYVESESPEEGGRLVRGGAKVLRDALEPHAYISSMQGPSRETNTKFWRYTFNVSFVTPR